MVQTLVDFAELLAATALLAILLTLPGAAIASWTGWLGVKEIKPAHEWGTALLFSLAVLPVLLSLVARFVSLDAAVATQLVFAVAGIPAARRIERLPRGYVLGLFACSLVLGLATIDFQFGGKIYQPTVSVDMVKHVATVNSILSWGLPLTDPFVSRVQPAGYYYFFYTLAAIPVRLTGTIDPRSAVGALAALDGVAVLALAALLWQRAEPEVPLSRNAVLALIALLLCGNLDIVPSFATGVVKHIWPIEIEWWNEQIAPWTISLIWVPHHVLALVAGVFGLVLIAERPGTRSVIAGGLAFASCAGVSVWIGVGTALAAAFWLVSLILRKRYQLALTLVAAGCLAAVLLVPEALDILHGRSDEGSPIAFTVRVFGPLKAVMPPSLVRDLLSLPLLPLNYFFEFGIFGVGAIVYWWKRRAPPKTEAARILVFAAAAGLLLGTFARSTLINNDLGWRVVLLPQLAFLIWTAAVILSHSRDGQFHLGDLRRWPSAMGALLLIGYAGNAYELFSMRAYPFLAPNVILIPENALQPGLDAELASAYRWANAHVPRNAILQHNPVAAPRVLDFGLYGRNRVAVADKDATLYGASKAEVDARLAAVGPIFTGPLTAAQVRSRAAAYGIDVLVVSSADPFWSDAHSWVWSAPVLFASPHVRLIATRDLGQER